MNIDMNGPNNNLLEPKEMASNDYTDSMLFDDDNFMLDTTQDLPIRKPQSAYVIFGRMVSLCFIINCSSLF